MRTVRRLLYRDISASVAFVTVAFLALFFFIDFVDELDRMTRRGAGPGAASLMALFKLPGHIYEVFPITVLIGSIYSLARMAQSSEFTILRTGGLSPSRALSLLATLALGFAVTTFVVGDYLAPWTEKQAEAMRTHFDGGKVSGKRGAWLKDKQTGSGGERSFSVNVKEADVNGDLRDVRIFEFNAQGRLQSRTQAAAAHVGPHGLWLLHDVQRDQWIAGNNTADGTDNSADDSSAGAQAPYIVQTHLQDLQWQSGLSADVISAALLPAWTMSTLELYHYTAHLSEQAQASQQYQIQFWRKAFYPFACLVMVALALPFAYLHGRSGGISLKVFGGIMLGISFVLLNNLAGHVGLLKQWTPWVVSASPSLLYLG
ncbi:MAG: LPS export ABC transporter permease LptG, partial [Paucibacter sp.]|nr:LPS export ABC transporter permease LptG [Roseateles sp.]